MVGAVATTLWTAVSTLYDSYFFVVARRQRALTHSLDGQFVVFGFVFALHVVYILLSEGFHLCCPHALQGGRRSS